MRTLDSTPARSGRLARLARDVRLLARIVAMAWGYWTHGGRVRRELRLAERAGRIYWLDR